MPTTKEEYWAKQNAQINSQAIPTTSAPTPTPKPVVWTPAPTPRKSYAPTEDQCRGVACKYEGECRSRLGFCGTGIVYCNSASSWVPSCPGGGGKIRLDDENAVTSTRASEPLRKSEVHWRAEDFADDANVRRRLERVWGGCRWLSAGRCPPPKAIRPRCDL